VLVKLDGSDRLERMEVKEYVASILGRKTDITTHDSLHKTLQETIEATAVRLFQGVNHKSGVVRGRPLCCA
jgi:predicted nucleotidyltransferase